METFFGLVAVWLMSSTGIGVGSSTLAIASFLVALKDGTIDPSERRMLGVIYTALRVSMVMLGIALLLLGVLFPGSISGMVFLWVLMFMLVFNAVLMTKHWISPKIGPAFQAATWYTFGFMMSIEAFSLLPLSWTVFLVLYVADIIVAILVVNGLMSWSKRQQQQAAPATPTAPQQ